MAALGSGNATPKKRKGRTLSVCDPAVKSAFQAIEIDPSYIGETTRWGNSLAASVRRFNAGREVLQGNRRINKREAESMWRNLVCRDRKPNALGAYSDGRGR